MPDPLPTTNVPPISAAVIALQDDWEALRALSFEERGRMLDAACSDAAAIERSRIANGLPPSVPAPWPESTRQWLAHWAKQCR